MLRLPAHQPGCDRREPDLTCCPSPVGAVALSGSGFMKGLAGLQICRWWLGFNADELLETNERALGAVEYTRRKTSWRHQCGRKHYEGYFLPLPCQHATMAA